MVVVTKVREHCERYLASFLFYHIFFFIMHDKASGSFRYGAWNNITTCGKMPWGFRLTLHFAKNVLRGPSS